MSWLERALAVLIVLAVMAGAVALIAWAVWLDIRVLNQLHGAS